MATLNFAVKTICIGEYLGILGGMIREFVGLICTNSLFYLHQDYTPPVWATVPRAPRGPKGV